MIIHVHADASISLEDPDTFTAFSIHADGLDRGEIMAALGRDAKPDGDGHLWISIARLHALGEVHGAAGWRAGCDAMIEFAASKGWIDERGERVRAHVE